MAPDPGLKRVDFSLQASVSRSSFISTAKSWNTRNCAWRSA